MAKGGDAESQSHVLRKVDHGWHCVTRRGVAKLGKANQYTTRYCFKSAYVSRST